MGRKGETRERIVEAATDLFHRQGYRNTSLAAVGDRAGAQTGSLYYFFKTKEEMLRAVLERYGELLGPVIMEPALVASTDPIERVFLILDRYRALLLETGFGLGCPIGNLAIEMAEAGPGIRAGIAASFDLWADTVRQVLDEGSSRLPPGLDVRRLARFVLTVMEGGVLLARGYRDIEPFDDAVHQLRDYFEYLQGKNQKERRARP